MDLEKWKTFFCDAGIPEDKTATYASIFADNEIQADMLVDLNKDYLLDMGITVIGHVIAIIRYAKQKSSKAVIGEASASTTDTPSSEIQKLKKKYEEKKKNVKNSLKYLRKVINSLQEDKRILEEGNRLAQTTATILNYRLQNLSKFRAQILLGEAAYKVKQLLVHAGKAKVCTFESRYGIDLMSFDENVLTPLMYVRDRRCHAFDVFSKKKSKKKYVPKKKNCLNVILPAPNIFKEFKDLDFCDDYYNALSNFI